MGDQNDFGYQITFKCGDKADWELNNPILARGEPGLEMDTKSMKIGTGDDHWLDLEYWFVGGGGGVSTPDVTVVDGGVPATVFTDGVVGGMPDTIFDTILDGGTPSDFAAVPTSAPGIFGGTPSSTYTLTTSGGSPSSSFTDGYIGGTP